VLRAGGTLVDVVGGCAAWCDPPAQPAARIGSAIQTGARMGRDASR
jgi:hypothetical protein